MKTAISLPDDTFHAADKRAHELGISRSEFFATAARHYLDELDRACLTRKMNEALERVTVDDTADVAVEAGKALLAAGDDW